MSKLEDLTGQKFGRLTVIEFDKNSKKGKTRWICSCECGGTTSSFAFSLKNGRAKSCGCLQKEKVKELFTKHSLSYTRVYRCWQHMRARCNNENSKYYKYYGGRGISICEEWEDPEVFVKWALENGYSDGLTLDRIDPNGNYCPENCRWATWKEQARNKRTNVYATYEDKTMVAKDWSKELGLSDSAVGYRLKNGWDVEEAVTKKVNRIYLTFNGKTMEIPGWSKETGISIQTIKRRIKSGWSTEDALTIPPSKSNTNHAKR